MRPPPSHVTSAHAGVVRVHVGDVHTVAVLNALGFHRDLARGEQYARSTRDDLDTARLVATLRDAGLLFARGREWSPAEVFEHLRDRGLLRGLFRSLIWLRPGVWMTRDD